MPSLKNTLKAQIVELQSVFSRFSDPHLLGVLLFGSCARGEATYRSDVDILLVFETSHLTYGFVQSARDNVEKHFRNSGKELALSKPLPVQTTVVASSVFATNEPGMTQALTESLLLFDRKGTMKDNLSRFRGLS